MQKYSSLHNLEAQNDVVLVGLCIVAMCMEKMSVNKSAYILKGVIPSG